MSSCKRWFSWTGAITGFGAGEVSVVNNADGSGNMVCKEAGLFYLFGVRDALGSANEWYYDSPQNEINAEQLIPGDRLKAAPESLRSALLRHP